MNDIALRDDTGFAAKIDWAKQMAGSRLLPKEYQNNPANLLYAVEYADALGIDRINALTSIHVINGKPTASADLIAGLIRKAGHKLRITGDDTFAEATLIRKDDPEFAYVARWDVRKATAAKLWGKGNWATYPGAMLRARAITEVARMGGSDALYGVNYTPEELGHGTTTVEVGAPVTAADILGKTEDPKATGEQLAQIVNHAATLGLDPDQTRAGVEGVVSRSVPDVAELTELEAAAVIARLQTKIAEKQPETIEGELVDDSNAQWTDES